MAAFRLWTDRGRGRREGERCEFLPLSLPPAPHTACLFLPPLLYDLIAARRLCRRRRSRRFCNLQSPIEERDGMSVARWGREEQGCKTKCAPSSSKWTFSRGMLRSGLRQVLKYAFSDPLNVSFGSGRDRSRTTSITLFPVVILFRLLLFVSLALPPAILRRSISAASFHKFTQLSRSLKCRTDRSNLQIQVWVPYVQNPPPLTSFCSVISSPAGGQDRRPFLRAATSPSFPRMSGRIALLAADANIICLPSLPHERTPPSSSLHFSLIRPPPRWLTAPSNLRA